MPKINLQFKLTLLFILVSLTTTIVINLIWLKIIPLELPALTTLVVSLSLGSVLGILFSQMVSSPVKKLLEESLYLSKGQFSYRIELNLGDELEQLANNLNAVDSTISHLLQKTYLSEQLALAEKNKLEVIVTNLVDGIIVLDINRQVMMLSRAAQKITGFTSSEVIGKPIAQVFQIYFNNTEIKDNSYCPRYISDDFPIFTKGGVKLVSKKILTKSPETKALLGVSQEDSRPQNTYVDLTSVGIVDNQKRLIGYLVTLHDISKEKQLEVMKVDFISMAAHELRTPLTSAKGYLSVFLQENADKFNPDQKMLLDRVSISVQQLNSLVENLLNVSRIERGAITLNTTRLDWVKLVKQVVSDLLLRASNKRIDLKFIESQTPTSPVQADQLRIIEVLNNLIANAINYTQPGGKIRVFLEQKNGEVITHVADNGQGISKDALPHLFSKFYRASGKLVVGTKGSGLGLYISKVIVEMHKGKIWVASQEGKGSTFSFSLPIAIPIATAPTPEAIVV